MLDPCAQPRQAASALPGAPTLHDADEHIQVVAVCGADVVQAQLLEEGGARPGDQAARVLVDLGSGFLHSHNASLHARSAAQPVLAGGAAW